ncbi:MBOAT family O-acyltransferase [Butyrivibrio sp. CB08]|uniref:MBOAT family O-acyltransferase n=1 Tax=Butyrivibrio sp. CB08 TaxID=2364879 RepID=UPI00211058EE|nr:MBOAT family O-acyltransferase [Butyrivibrio sp. CB08]
MSLLFYGYFNPWYLFIICGSVLFNYFFSKIVFSRKSKTLLTIGIIVNVSVIFYFKYFDFFKECINTAFKTDFVISNIVIPLGISFYTFQQISFLVDSYKGETSDYSFLEYALFVTFFPQLIAGPIVLHNELIPQFRNTSNLKPNADNIYSGLVLFSFGLAKKVLLADTYSRCVDWAWNGNLYTLTSLEIFIVMLSYTFQIYFDFSAYSDMATGIARCFNFALPMNFNSPYKAMTIPDFWKRWHMTLTRFFKTVYLLSTWRKQKGYH